jgi:hypothetical protein
MECAYGRHCSPCEGHLSIATHGPTVSFTLDKNGICIAARSSENGVTVRIDPSLYNLLD